jgi:hypothetical protein
MKKLSRILLASLMMVSAINSIADERSRTPNPAHEGLEAAWALVECGERYKEVWFNGEEVRGVNKTYSELLESYDQPPGDGCTDYDTHAEYLHAAADTFKTLTKDSSLQGTYNGDMAIWGLQESLNFLAEGKLVKGNDLMINGLRTRFKVDQNDTRSQIEYLNDSVAEMKSGLDAVTPYFIAQPELLRISGDASPQFPFLVNNTAGPVAPNEYMRYAELLNRYGMAGISEAKYMYYRDNVKDVDNPPYRNFPGPEDLDFNNDRVENEAGRIEAASRAKKISSHLYLQTLVLASQQNEDQFEDNNGYQIKRQLNDADRLYQDIQSGFNPLLLAGDFVPYQRLENFLQLARARVNDATAAEALARTNQRSFEVDQTTLRSELRSQTSQYIDQLEELSGLSTSDFDLTTKEGRDDYKAAVHASVWGEDHTGQIGIQVIGITESELQRTHISTQIQNVYQRVQNELDRSATVVNLVMANGKRISALQYANTMASCCNVSTGTSTGTSEGTSTGSSVGESVNVSTDHTFGANGMGAVFGETVGFSAGVSFGQSEGTSKGKSWGTSTGESKNPNIETLASGQSAMALLQATQQADLEGVNSNANIKNILLELATLNVSMEQAEAALERQVAVVETQYKQFERILANYTIAQEDFAEAYYNNPAYRMEASRAEQAAEDTFETALELSYYAAKALEYQWSEKFNNPVLRLDGGLPEPLSVSFDPFQRAESVFSAQFASLYSPSLDDFLDGLQAWDVKMRQLRYPERNTSRVRFSLRDDLLGYGEFTPSVAEAKFRSFIEDQRTVGDNPDNRDLQFQFGLDIADERLFPNHPNIKIESVKLNLVSTASRSVRGGATTGPALVDLVMLDRAFVRTFFAEYPDRDDILSYTLQQGRTIDKSPFLATVDATIDGYASPLPEGNKQLAGHSPAVNTWILRMRNSRYNNRNLRLEYLSDIEIEVEYSYGKPRDFQFSN